MKNKSINYEAVLALVVKIFLGMFLYWIMNGFRHVSNFFPYNDVVTKVNQQGFYKFIYFVMNFTEGEFYGGLFTTLFLLIGGLIAWQLYRKNSKWQGFAIAGGSGLVPDILMGQMIASAVGVFLYRKHFAEEGWYPTFMPLVSIVPGVILMMGGGFWLSLTIAVLAGISAAPVGSYIAKRLPPFVPGAVGFVSGMAVVTILLSAVLHTFDIFV
ncbi:TPA: hypothetical protein RHK00_001350 [Enterococcus faecalis]|nr:hypothetical protein [Enterococcus faecalis]HDV0819605.1 hypothetical protein [Enterococcus faecalis]